MVKIIRALQLDEAFHIENAEYQVFLRWYIRLAELTLTPKAFVC